MWLGGHDVENHAATREAVEHLRDVALMFKRAADELSGLLNSGQLA